MACTNQLHKEYCLLQPDAQGILTLDMRNMACIRQLHKEDGLYHLRKEYGLTNQLDKEYGLYQPLK